VIVTEKSGKDLVAGLFVQRSYLRVQSLMDKAGHMLGQILSRSL